MYIIPARDPKQCEGTKRSMYYNGDDDDDDDDDGDDDDCHGNDDDDDYHDHDDDDHDDGHDDDHDCDHHDHDDDDHDDGHDDDHDCDHDDADDDDDDDDGDDDSGGGDDDDDGDVRACAVEMHMDISQEPFRMEIYRGNKWRRTPRRPAFCTSLGSRNAHGHFTRAILYGILQGKGPTRRIPPRLNTKP